MRSTYRLIQPAQGHKLTLHAFVLRGLAACCARGDARIIRLDAPNKRLHEAPASGTAGAVPAEMLTFDQVHALVADGCNVGILPDPRQMLRRVAARFVLQADDRRV